MIQKFTQFIDFLNEGRELKKGFYFSSLTKGDQIKDKNDKIWTIVSVGADDAFIKNEDGKQIEITSLKDYTEHNVKSLNEASNYVATDKEFWNCELKFDKDLEEQANDMKFKKEDELKKYLKGKGYQGVAKFELIAIDTFHDGEDNSSEPNVIKTKNITI